MIPKRTTQTKLTFCGIKRPRDNDDDNDISQLKTTTTSVSACSTTTTASDNHDLTTRQPILVSNPAYASAKQTKVSLVTSTEVLTSTSVNVIDIGLCVKPTSQNLSDRERLDLLQCSWTAPIGFCWHHSERQDKGKIRRKYLGPQHFTGIYDVFSYSIVKEGLFCKPCIMFAPQDVGGIKLDKLVKSPLEKYAHLTGGEGCLTSHLSTVYH